MGAKAEFILQKFNHLGKPPALYANVTLNTRMIITKEINILKSTLGDKDWYPKDPASLQQLISLYRTKTEPKLTEKPIALVLPHAGYKFSGSTAMEGIQTLRKHHYHKVIIIGPTHYYRIPNKACIPNLNAIETPLGQIQIDTKLINHLKNEPHFHIANEVFEEEHSIEIQLPLLQSLDCDFSLIPIILGDCDYPTIQTISNAIKPLLDNDTLLVISSDFTHYGEGFDYLPFKENIKHNIRTLDHTALALIQSKNKQDFNDYISTKETTICGKNAIQILLELLKDENEGTLLDYHQTGSLTDDWSHSVSYASMAFTGYWN